VTTSAPIVFALSAAQPRGGVALLRGEETLFASAFPEGERGGTALKPKTEEALRFAPDGRVDVVAVGLGPGSFTGSRVAVSFATFFAFGRGLPVLGVCDLEALALEIATDGEKVASGIVAHDGAIFGAVYEGVAALEPRVLAAPEVLSAEAFAAAAASFGARVALAPPLEIAAAAIGRLAARRFLRTGVGDDPVLLEPLYLRPSAPERKGTG
jgi:tRNA threonylcarbamoyl adenosine modification protein YeaZ